MGYSLWGHRESDAIEHTHLSFIIWVVNRCCVKDVYSRIRLGTYNMLMYFINLPRGR